MQFLLARSNSKSELWPVDVASCRPLRLFSVSLLYKNVFKHLNKLNSNHCIKLLFGMPRLQCDFRCRRMPESFLGHCKSSLSNLISSDLLRECEDTLRSFSEAISNFFSHTSSWCHHDKVIISVNIHLNNEHQSIAFSPILFLGE